MAGSPYRELPAQRHPVQRRLDPWYLALLFAWVCDVVRVAYGLVGHRSVGGEVGFAGVLAVVTAVVVVVRLKQRRR
jgi:hypothetical protein